YGAPMLSNDGVSVAREITLPEPFESMGAKMVAEVAKKTNDVAGDGTTAATVLTEAIFLEGLRHIAAGANPVLLQRGINAGATAAAKAIDDMSVKCKGKEDYIKVATVSASHDAQIGKIIAEAIAKVGPEGVVEVEEGKASETTLDYTEGMSFDKGYISPYFMTDPKTGECVLENCLVLLYEKKIANLTDFLPFLNKVALSGKTLLIIAEEVESEALAALVVNRLRGVLKVCAVKAPGFGDRRKAIMGDLAVLTAGTFFAEDIGRSLESIELNELGTAKRVVINKDETIVVEGGGKKSEIKTRADQIKAQHDKSTSDYDREKLMERLAKLTGGVAVISVGGTSEVAVKEKKDAVDDALHSTRAAAKEGYVPGGGVALIRTQDAILKASKAAKTDDEKTGYQIVARAVEACAYQIAENAGVDGDIVVSKIKEGSGGFGFNASTHEYVDLVKAGIIDAALVPKTSLINAASVAGLMLTTDVMITELKDDSKATTGATA
ncbi:MAG: chaperonin GroEL, partial [Phycisphaerales bacterium]|nr:chaperonin GroEL [Phycisphaerales bacterium]